MSENYEQEKAVYIRRLGAQIETIQKILDTNTLDLIDASREDKLRKLKNEAERYKQKLEKNEFEIAIVGLEKAGKSTFANAMMGYDILPSDEKRCTYTSTKIRSGNNSGNVKFFTRDEFNSNFRANLKTMEIENADSYSFESLSKSSYESMFNRLDEKTKKAYGDNINEDVKTILDNKNTINSYLGHSDLLLSITTNDFERFIKDPGYALAVREVSIFLSKMVGISNAIIYDVPGFDSHKTQTKEFMSKADAIVLVSRANEPSFKDSEMNLFDDYKGETDEDETILADKMFPFANKVDIVKADNGRTWDEQVERNLEVIKKDLKNYCNFTKAERITIGSAYANLHSLEVPNGHTDGIKEIKDKLQHYYDTERFEILKRRINQKQNEFNELACQLSSTPQTDLEKPQIKMNIKNVETEISTLSDFIKCIHDLESTEAHETFFRGESTDYGKTALIPSIFRNNYIANEDIMFNKIVALFPDTFPKGMDTIEILATMRHYELPTRVLDISHSAYVALALACLYNKSKDGYVYIFHVPRNQIKDWNSDTVCLLANLAKMHEDYLVNEDYNKKLFDKLQHEIVVERPHFFNLHEKKEYLYAEVFKKIICVQPKLTNNRIRNQQGAFFLYGINGKKSEYYNLVFDPNIIIYKLKILSKHKGRLSDELFKSGFEFNYIYPDLGSVSKNLTEMYKGQNRNEMNLDIELH